MFYAGEPESPTQRSPNPGRTASPVIEEAPASPMVYRSQYRIEAYGRINTSRTRTRTLGVPVSRRDCPCQRRRRSPPLTCIKNGDLYVHKDYEGRLHLCCYVTGLNEGGPPDFYPCYTSTKRDVVWARSVRFHNERERN